VSIEISVEVDATFETEVRCVAAINAVDASQVSDEQFWTVEDNIAQGVIDITTRAGSGVMSYSTLKALANHQLFCSVRRAGLEVFCPFVQADYP
jgi:hypothetical protein